jgi:hypothetical protein
MTEPTYNQPLEDAEDIQLNDPGSKTQPAEGGRDEVEDQAQGDLRTDVDRAMQEPSDPDAQ